MAGRSEARIFVTIWKDDDFVNLSPSAQRMFFFLLSQPDLTHAGVIPLRERRWARSAAGLTLEQVAKDLEALTGGPHPFVVIDEATEELFVRSLIRLDGVWKQPNLMKSAIESAEQIDSDSVRTALLEELRRIPVEETSSELVRRVHADFVAMLEKGSANPSDNPSPDPPDRGSGNHSRNPTPDPTQGKGESNGGEVEGSPSPCSPVPLSTSEIATDAASATAVREDVERICTHLADRVEANGSKRPTITKKWRDAARLLMDKDGRTEQQIHTAIDWCQDSEFWRGNVMSLPTLRDQYDRLRLQATRSQSRASPNSAIPRTSTTDQRVMDAAALAQRLAEEETRAS